jgi:thioredoxin-related protein
MIKVSLADKMPKIAWALILACAVSSSLSFAQNASTLPQEIIVTSAQPGLSPLARATDLHQSARLSREKRKPILLAFTLTQCPYCAIVRQRYLATLDSDPRWHDKLIVLELPLDAPALSHDFSGQSTTAATLARRFDIKKVPTLLIFNDQGQALAPPLVGFNSEDFYGAYLEQLLETGLKKMRPE